MSLISLVRSCIRALIQSTSSPFVCWSSNPGVDYHRDFKWWLETSLICPCLRNIPPVPVLFYFSTSTFDSLSGLVSSSPLRPRVYIAPASNCLLSSFSAPAPQYSYLSSPLLIGIPDRLVYFNQSNAALGPISLCDGSIVHASYFLLPSLLRSYSLTSTPLIEA